MAKQFLDYAGLKEFWNKIKGFVAANYVANVDGKGLSTNDFTNDDKSKLAGIESGAQVNVITGIKMEGAADNLTPTPSNKVVTIPVDNSLSSTSINPVQNKVVYTAIATLASAVDKSVQSAEGDAYVSASLSAVGDGTQDGQKLTVAATQELKNAITTAKTALQKADIVSGTSNGTISVGGEDVAVKGLGSAAYTESSAYAPASLSTQVETNKNDITSLKGSIAGLSSATHFIGVVTELPTTSNNGDICIKGNKEYIYSKPEESATGSWVELGDVTDVSERITEIENSYISSFGGVGGKQKAIKLDTDATGAGNVKFAMSGDELQATVDVGITMVKVNTATPVENETAETVAVAVEKPFAMITSVSQTNGTVNVGTTELGPIPISAITALV